MYNLIETAKEISKLYSYNEGSKFILVLVTVQTANPILKLGDS